ncbi:MAG: hypothetical protein JNL14_15985 [Devosia sp.]|uniref:hypothetical protein n=1 Tax=Devosia sp. TaxID=1871048 RepID=UPI001A5E1C2D|nr:hypothetical protein [Devosia sp.]MBL8599233.1 hypothetical protein [Devosia sp.]
MTDRLNWQRGDKPFHYVAYPTGDPEECEVSVYYGHDGGGGKMMWHYAIRAGGTHRSQVAESKQFAADLATARWRQAVEDEAAAVGVIEDVDDMRMMIQAARLIGVVQIGAFEIEASSADRVYYLQRLVTPYAKGDALRPLAEVLEAELARRRESGHNPGLGIYGTYRAAQEIAKLPPIPDGLPAYMLN